MRVAIIEDHPLFRDSLRLLLTSEGMTVVAEAGDVAGSHTVWSTKPDIVVVDLALPDGSGEQVVADAAEHCPTARVMVLSMATDATSVTRAFAAGAHGYLVKDASADEVVTAIKAVAAGSMVMGARVAPRLHGSDAIAALAPSEREFPGLTTRERQVLGLVADGQSNAQIADALAVSGKTVANYVSALLSSLHARDRSHLAEMVNTRRPSPTRATPPAEAPEPERVSRPGDKLQSPSRWPLDTPNRRNVAGPAIDLNCRAWGGLSAPIGALDLPVELLAEVSGEPLGR